MRSRDCGWHLAEWLERLTANTGRHAQYWVQSQHPQTQWNLRGGKWSSVEYSTIFVYICTWQWGKGRGSCLRNCRKSWNSHKQRPRRGRTLRQICSPKRKNATYHKITCKSRSYSVGLTVQNNASMYLWSLWVCEVECSNFDFFKKNLRTKNVVSCKNEF